MAIIYYFTPRVTIYNFNPFYKRFSKIEVLQAFVYKLQSYFIKGLFKFSYEYQAWFPRYFLVFYCIQYFEAYGDSRLGYTVLYYLQCIVHVKTSLINKDNVKKYIYIKKRFTEKDGPPLPPLMSVHWGTLIIHFLIDIPSHNIVQ